MTSPIALLLLGHTSLERDRMSFLDLVVNISSIRQGIESNVVIHLDTSLYSHTLAKTSSYTGITNTLR